MNTLLVLATSVACAAPLGQAPTSSPATQSAPAVRRSEIRTFADAQAFLQRRAEQIIARCRVFTDDGTAAYLPDDQKNYRAFWLRDFCYMVEGCPGAFQEEDLTRAYRWLSARQQVDGSAPDRVELNGTAVYSPGPVDHPLCTGAVADGPQFMVKLAYAIVRQTRNEELFSETSEKLALGMHWLIHNSETDLITAPEGSSRCSYGFTDTVGKKGDLLFCSLLYIDAATKLSELMRDAGNGGQSQYWEGQAARARAGLETLWDWDTGYYRAASVRCRQPDVWGTAYAVYLGVTTPERSQRIGRQLLKDYDRIIQAGQVRHLPAPLMWESCVTLPGTYQNGGYWGTASGWVYAAMRQADPRRAEQIIIDLARDYEARDAVPEWTNGAKSALTGYAASVATPLEAIRKVASTQAAH
jgi:hypothetical protein